MPVKGHRKVRYADSRVEEVPWVAGVRIEVRGRNAVVSALVGAPGSTALLGQIPLEEMDFVIDPKSRGAAPQSGVARRTGAEPAPRRLTGVQ